MKTLKLTFIGWNMYDNLPVYESESGNLYCDTDPISKYKPRICNRYKNEFYGEPDTPIRQDIVLEFIPKRMVWR